ncbi:hypothetical protein CTAYLR_010398 [Chrysophaeum taylorii]|uniref:Sulfotransferase n=1 Tax=Chrysophaeum taylorii TaxID=2483200 RepID=A0AAD7UJW0_9STRA|nr:hypothetical protein CTAYLR_010398 [Chrysophaeum taylorii]
MMLSLSLVVVARASSCEIGPGRPDVLIVGAVKAGTTALFGALSRGRKEVYYFNNDDRYERGVDFYADQLRCGDVDATPLYLVHPVALQRAALDVPWATWIVLVREPVDRAFSHYNMLLRFAANERRRKGATGPDDSEFEEVIAPEVACYHATRAGFEDCVRTRVGGTFAELLPPEGKLKEFGALNGLLSQGMMAPQLERARAFGPAKLLAVSQRALYDDGSAVLRALLALLGREPTGAPLRRYESLSDHTHFDTHDGAGPFGGHRHRVNATTLARLDALFERPNRALARILFSCGTTTVVDATVGFRDHDAHWLPQCPDPPDL